jgi:hypothetical protein
MSLLVCTSNEDLLVALAADRPFVFSPELEDVYLPNRKVNQLRTFWTALKGNRTIKTLVVSSLQVLETLDLMVESLLDTSLETIQFRFSHFVDINRAARMNFAKIFSLKTLKRVYGGSGIFNGTFKYIITQIKDRNDFQELCIPECEDTTSTAEELFREIFSKTSLKQLHVSVNPVLQHNFPDFISNMNYITSLSISQNSFSYDDFFFNFFEALLKNSTLKKLELKVQYANESFCNSLGLFLKRNTSLKELVCNCESSWETFLKNFGIGLSQNTTLEVLSFKAGYNWPNFFDYVVGTGLHKLQYFANVEVSSLHKILESTSLTSLEIPLTRVLSRDEDLFIEKLMQNTTITSIHLSFSENMLRKLDIESLKYVTDLGLGGWDVPSEFFEKLERNTILSSLKMNCGCPPLEFSSSLTKLDCLVFKENIPKYISSNSLKHITLDFLGKEVHMFDYPKILKALAQNLCFTYLDLGPNDYLAFNAQVKKVLNRNKGTNLFCFISTYFLPFFCVFAYVLSL